MTAPQEISTARLVLRPPVPADAEAIFERYSGDPEVTRYLSWPQHRTVDETRAFVDWSETEWRRAPAGPYLIFSRADMTLLGGTGLRFETPARAEVGYVLARDAWGRGFATEALAAMVDLAADLGVQRLQAMCHPDHRPSHRVLEKCEFELEGRLRAYAEFPNLEPGISADVLSYVRTLARWQPQPRSGPTVPFFR